MNMDNLRAPLRVDQIDFRVQSINKGGYATILAYKDARADMERLDEVVGPLNWKREHTRDNHNCVVSIWDDDKKQWVSKEDTGTESAAESQKGLASDSFKRACFNWGIGRELYEYPIISIKLNEDEYTSDGNRQRQTWKLRLRDWKWFSEFVGREIVSLKAIDNHGTERFSWTAETVRDPRLTAKYEEMLRLIATKEPWELRQFTAENHALMDDLFNMAPDGKKTRFKSDFREVYRVSNMRIKDLITLLESAVYGDSPSSDTAREIVEEMGALERKFVVEAMDEKLRSAIESLLGEKL